MSTGKGGLEGDPADQLLKRPSRSGAPVMGIPLEHLLNAPSHWIEAGQRTRI